MFDDELAENLGSLDVLQTDIEFHGCRDTAVAKQSPNQFIFSWPALQNDGTGGMAELMGRHPQAGRLPDPVGDLATERDLALGASVLARKKPVLVRAPQQGRPMVENILIDQPREVFRQWIFEPDTIFDIVIREHQPVVRVRSARLDEVYSEPDRRQISQANRRCDLRN